MGKKWRWGIILDAGSSGTRLHIYRWKDARKVVEDASADDLQRLPKLKTKKEWTQKIRPGVSTFGGHPQDVGPEHLQQLVDAAIEVIPAENVRDTPIFLMATAGMRLLPQVQQTALLREICSFFMAKTQFYIKDCDSHVQVIPGETEGLYGWISANYLLEGFDHPEKHGHGKGHHTYGFLDMGGASAQIAFAPNSTEAEKHSNDLKLLRLRKMGGQPSEYQVFTATWLGFGVNQARENYVKGLENEYGSVDSKELPDPCMPKGLRTTLKGQPVAGGATIEHVTLIGTGDFNECLRKTYPLLRKDAPCHDDPCLLNGLHVPAIDFDVNHFIGVSEYWHTTHGVFGDKGDRPYDFNTYQKKVKEFCSRRWDDIDATLDRRKNTDPKTAQEACFKASWLINVLHEGIGIPRLGLEQGGSHGLNVSKDVLEGAKESGFTDPFRPIDKIHDIEVSWTLGRMLLYASGQIPPNDAGSPLPVGFGSNVQGASADFQDLGSSYKPVKLGEDDDWDADDLLEKAKDHKSASSLLALILLVVVLAFFFRKRERRMRCLGKFSSMFRRRRPGSPRKSTRGSFVNQLFGRNAPAYERVAEEGNAGQFELDEVDSDENEYSDSSEGSKFGRSSGLATPKLNVEFFDEIGAGSSMDRNGLVVRTESRERLVPMVINAGRRSRANSPTRLKSPLMAPLSER